ncbi:kinetochore protein Mis14 like-domain-containing protein [Talaromyces proteolyticus]|uniref:Kinetochore protein Mis14 like-domain-containing protein n=1 Tax=Talaromyces proteolyticus TaxID=1131652 RepID=A0AAD4PXV4_9EURO|nr:kinetochore protein Mis14 like-domain-containing protein [Talaromyces proteolyticus]KAH8697064.1 kinetochore protein Mis14 like-domain-containing protein [Talaromyces proteolyticus]
MQSPHYRKIELQSNADFNYLYTNTLACLQEKLNEIYPPPQNDNADDPYPVKGRVKKLMEEFIQQTYILASDSITINGVDVSPGEGSTGLLPFDSGFSAPETIEYEPYDGALASRVTSLYAQLESLTTSVAQLRREAPQKAAKAYSDTLIEMLKTEDAEYESLARQQQDSDSAYQSEPILKSENGSSSSSSKKLAETGAVEYSKIKPEWKLDIPFGSDSERERWQSGEMAEVYSDTLRTLLRLQGEYVEGDEPASVEASRNALSTTVGTAERASRAAEVVKKM